MAETNNPYEDKIKKDKDNLAKLRVGSANQQLIDAAYLGARNEPSEVVTWMNAAESGLTSFTEAIEKGKKAKQDKLDESNSKIDAQVDNLITTGYSLGETYYGAANTYTKALREKYLAAEGDPELQNKIKMELNVASQNIGSTKQAIETLATAWGEDPVDSDLERSGLDKDQIRLIETVFDEKNATWIEGENTFGWIDPESGQVYKVEDIQKLQKIASKDFVGKEAYIKDEQGYEVGGLAYKKGVEGSSPFDKDIAAYANEKRITEDNIRFYINGDFTGDGTTFQEAVIDHPDWKQSANWDAKIFEHLADVKLDKMEGYVDDGVEGITVDDFKGLDPTPEDNVLTEDDKAEVMRKIYTAVTDPKAVGYDFDVTKGLISEYMTLRQEKAFYGGKTMAELANINPGATKEDGTPLYTTKEEYEAAGGNIGFALEHGYSYQEKVIGDDGKTKTEAGWVYNPGNDLQKVFTKNTSGVKSRTS
mgnify:CR=1 FL=1|tara:strand:+ start:6200 stop:7633 length:1434 start_codon:yes stop_codon:yes gene_type:complete